MKLTTTPVAKAALLIRKPIAEVYEAFVDPEIVTNFWFDKSTGRLESGKSVQWHWTMFDMIVDVKVLDAKENEHIEIEWGTSAEDTSTAEWTFEQRSPDTTFITIVNRDFPGDIDKVVNSALDCTGGFALVLAAAKAWLEHGVRLNVVADGH